MLAKLNQAVPPRSEVIYPPGERVADVTIRPVAVVTADDVCPHLRAGRGADRGVARTGRRGAQLGLPLHLDPRCVVPAVPAQADAAEKQVSRFDDVAVTPSGQ